MKLNWFWKWIESICLRIDREEHVNWMEKLIVRILQFLGRKKEEEREKSYAHLKNLYYTAREELNEKGFQSWVSSAYWHLVGKIDETELERMKTTLNIMKD